MRYDYNRRKVNIEAKLWTKNKSYPVKISELSNYGCKFTGKVDIKLGSIIDLFISSHIFFTGTIKNKSKNSYGVSILSLSKNVFENISNFSKGKDIIHKTHKQFHNVTRILVLGAGAGKIFAQLELLKMIEKEKNQSLFSMFDCFVGVSSGGILSALLAMGHSLEKIHELLKENYQPWNIFHLNYFNSLLDNSSLKASIRNTFKGITFNALEKQLMLVSRNFSSGIYMYASNATEGQVKLEEVLFESISVPIFFGVENDMVDGAVGMFINPSEIILRHYRSLGQDMNRIKIYYLDAGFDPIHRFKKTNKNILTQLFWLLEITFKDLIISSLEKIDYHFPEVEFHPFIFSYSKNYDLLVKEDLINANKEIQTKSDDILEFIRNYI